MPLESIHLKLFRSFISISFGNSFGKSYIRFFSSKFKNLLELGVSHWREICIEMKEILLFANSSRRSSWKRISFSFAREKGRRERKIGGEREEEEEEKKELPRV